MSRYSRRTVLGLVAVMGLSFGAIPAMAADTTITAELWDKGGDMEMMKGMGMTMHGDMKMAPMGIKLSESTVPAGEVTFKATNSSKDLIHEMVVAPIADENTPLPYDATMERVDEDAAGSIGEVSELDPGASGEVTLTLKSGKYILYCNIAGHYASGMWTILTVQ